MNVGICIDKLTFRQKFLWTAESASSSASIPVAGRGRPSARSAAEAGRGLEAVDGRTEARVFESEVHVRERCCVYSNELCPFAVEERNSSRPVAVGVRGGPRPVAVDGRSSELCLGRVWAERGRAETRPRPSTCLWAGCRGLVTHGAIVEGGACAWAPMINDLSDERWANASLSSVRSEAVPRFRALSV